MTLSGGRIQIRSRAKIGQGEGNDRSEGVWPKILAIHRRGRPHKNHSLMSPMRTQWRVPNRLRSSRTCHRLSLGRKPRWVAMTCSRSMPHITSTSMAPRGSWPRTLRSTSRSSLSLQVVSTPFPYAPWRRKIGPAIGVILKCTANHCRVSSSSTSCSAMRSACNSCSTARIRSRPYWPSHPMQRCTLICGHRETHGYDTVP